MGEDAKKLQKGILASLIGEYIRDTNISIVKGLEIGTLGGLTLEYLLHNISKLEMVTVDPAPCWNDLERNLKTVRERVKIIQQKSDNAVKLWGVGEFDFVWVDGDHSYEQVRRDIKNYRPLVKAHGFIGGHDYNGCAGVKQAVDEAFGDRITLGDDYTWWIYV